ncbi:hypothetical protein PG996_006513 [Apiospora saccharicola]|uniref:Secreted protein n=1 Tax=Apiospora saccharicola TaxID=335842 RepID=A0ABR1VPI5_9PEZI
MTKQAGKQAISILILISLAHEPGSLPIRLPGNPWKNHEVYQGSVRFGPPGRGRPNETKRNETI